MLRALLAAAVPSRVGNRCGQAADPIGVAALRPRPRAVERAGDRQQRVAQRVLASCCGPASWRGALDEVLDRVLVVALAQRGRGQLLERAAQVAHVGGQSVGADDAVLAGALAVVQRRVRRRDQPGAVGGVARAGRRRRR